MPIGADEPERGGRTIDGVDELHRLLRGTTAGEPVQLGILRRGVPMTIELTQTWAA